MRTGIVYLVGAGPGDPTLITVKGVQCLQKADLVVYDRLSSTRLLDYAPATAERVFMGKEPDTPGEFQRTINEVLVQAARAGKTVVRLKGGDPFVFGRGGEEALTLQAEGVPFEIVPGITSAIAVPAYAGIPVTHRGLASAFTVVSGSEDPSKPEPSLDWQALASVPGTLVVLMGWRSLPHIVQALLDHGRAPGTPVAATQWGTLATQKTVSGTLATIVELGQQAGLSSPVVTVIGPVASLRESIRWFDTKPLFGKRVLVTRSRTQASTLVQQLTGQGADVVELPAIEIAPPGDYTALDGALERITRYQWLVLASANAVQVVFDRLRLAGKDARALGSVQVAAVGPATAEALFARGVVADFVPDTYTSEALAGEFRRFPMEGAQVLIPRADIGQDSLPEGLKALGASVDQITAYRTLQPAGAKERAKELLASGNINVATFTSSSTVRNLVELLGDDVALLQRVLVVTIGPSTSGAARELGLRVDVEAPEHTVPGLVRALVDYYTTSPLAATDFAPKVRK